jgi:hypothetical protein
MALLTLTNAHLAYGHVLLLDGADFALESSIPDSWAVPDDCAAAGATWLPFGRAQHHATC